MNRGRDPSPAKLARSAKPNQNGGMRIVHCLIVLFASSLSLSASPPAHADSTTIYRCESPDGISLQSRPCPKGVKQSKRMIQRPAEIAPALPAAPVSTTAPAASASPSSAPVTAAADIRGPNDPYPLWQCMRANGSTFESRDGVPGRQWVVKPNDADADTDTGATPAQITAAIAPPSAQVATNSTPPDPNAPPAGAAPGEWVADQCTRLEPQQACERYAARRDALRKQIYAAMPSERVKYAPEEQDLTRMLYPACGR